MDYDTKLVNQFVNQLALNERGLRGMHAFYVFEDKRPGTVVERFTEDAQKFWEVHSMFNRPSKGEEG